jgi:RNA polymerase sigma-70 factor (ECF subfamily)
MAEGGAKEAAWSDELVQREVVDRALHGDADAWEALYVRIRPRLFALCLRRLGNREDAEDAVAETMLRAVRAAGTFRWKNAGFDAWIFRIAHNVVSDMLRTRSRRASVPAGDTRPELGTVDEDFVVLADEHAAVRRALERLPGADRELLELRLVAGLSSEEVAYVLRKRAGAVRTAQSRALARLRTYLAEEDR